MMASCSERTGHGRLGAEECDGIREVAYTDTEHYLVTRGFLSNPQRSLKELLADEESASQVVDPN